MTSSASKAQSALRELRTRYRLTKTRLATKSGVPLSIVSEIEGGTRAMTVETALKTAPHLGTDPVALYLASTIPAIKAAVETGEESPVRAANVARSLVQAIEDGNLTASQRMTVRTGIEQLLQIVESAASKQRPGTLGSLVRRTSGQTYPLDPPQRDLEDGAGRPPFNTARDAEQSAETYEALGRDALGRAKPRKPGEDFVDPDMDYFAESGTPAGRRKKKTDAATKGSFMDELGRDNFGRRVDP